MKARRAVLVLAVAAAVLVVPATGQGKVQPPALYWTQVLGGGAAIPSYDFGPVQQSATTWFRLGNTSPTRSGRLKVTLTGSPAFSITENRCNGKNIRGIGPLLSCWVGVSYTPASPFASDNATLTGKGKNSKAVSLNLSGQGFFQCDSPQLTSRSSSTCCASRSRSACR